MGKSGDIRETGSNSVAMTGGKVKGGIKIGLDEEAVEALINNAVAVLSQQFEGVQKNDENLIAGVQNELVKQIFDIKNGQADIRGEAQNNFKRIEAHQQEFTSQIMTELKTLASRFGGMEEALSYFRSQSAKAADDNYDRFSKWQEDQIEARRQNLIRETSREHPNIDNVKKCALALSEMAPDDFLARFYLAVYSENYRDAITFLNEINVGEHTQEELKEVIGHLTKHLRSEWILSASALVERSSSVLGKDENSFRKEIRDPFEREVQKIGKGTYNVIPDGCVFIAYNHDDIAEVSKLIGFLEESPEIRCFAAFRNVRNGLGAGEYDKILRRAMGRCSVFVLYSTYQSRNMGGSFDEMDHIVQDDYNRAERSGHSEFGTKGDYRHLPAEYKKPRIEYLKENYRPNEANSLAKMFFGDARHRTEPTELRNRILDLLHGYEEEPSEEQPKKEVVGKTEGEGTTKAPKKTEGQRREEEAERSQAEEATRGEDKTKPWLAPDYPTLKNYDKTQFEIEGTTFKKYLKKDFAGEVKIPRGVESVGMDAFRGYKLTSIIIPDSVKSIGWWAFYGCSRLTSITIPNSVTSIGWGAFGGCRGLTSITIPKNVTSIGNFAFGGCSGLTSITIPESVTSIGALVFGDCRLLTIYCEASEKPMGWHPMWNPDNCPVVWDYKHHENKKPWITPDYPTLENYDKSEFDIDEIDGKPTLLRYLKKNFDGEVKIPFGVICIEEGAFKPKILEGENEILISSITIPNSVTTISKEAFQQCTRLTELIIPDSVTRLGVDAFFDFENLERIEVAEGNPEYRSEQNCLIERSTNSLLLGCKNSVIPDGVTVIKGNAFYACIGLTSVKIPTSATSIEDYAFDFCIGLERIEVAEGNPEYRSEQNCLIERSTNSLVLGCKNSVIPSNVTSIGRGAFEGCGNLTSIVIPNSVTEIEWDAFYACVGLTSVKIPDSVTAIGSCAFRACISLTTITIPNRVESIKYGTFMSCFGLTSITIGSCVTKIEEYSFADCNQLKRIQVATGNTVYKSEGNCLIDIKSNQLVLGCGSSCIPEYVTSIGPSAFKHGGLTSITIPNSVTSIWQWAFAGCRGLTSIAIPDSVTVIGAGAFSSCSGLTSVFIPKSVTRLGEKAFERCGELKIYCAAKKQPKGWNDNWNPDHRPVVWGYNK